MIRIFKLSALLVLALAVCAFGEKTRYDNYRLVRIFVDNEAHSNLIQEWDNSPDFDLWLVGQSGAQHADVLLSPLAFAKYNAIFTAENMRYEILQRNIQDVIDEEERQMAKTKGRKLSRADIIHKYVSYADIQTFISETVDDNPDIASVYQAGESVEKRPMRVIVLKSSTSTKPVWIDCGIHAREWVSPPTCIHIIDRLTKSDKKLLDDYEFHILPVVNPDGYEYSRLTSRLWRKNRRPNILCAGVDLNRNYNEQWMANGGASSSQCSETYAGPSAESEPETKAVVSSIKQKLGKWVAFFTIHSYGQWWLISPGHVKTPAPDHSEMLRVANAGVAAIKTVHNSTFVAGQSSNLLYINSGSSQDWAKGGANIKYSYTLELRPGQDSPDASYGFTLPEDRVPFLARETFEGIKAALAAIP